MKTATEETLRELTGRKSSPAQQRVLKANNVPFIIDGNGRVKVADEILRRRLLGETLTTMSVIAEPDFAFFERRRV